MLPLRLLPSRATLVRAIPSPDGYGGTTTNWTDPVADGIPCRIDFPSVRTRFQAKVDGKEIFKAGVMVYLNYYYNDQPLDIHENDKMVIDGEDYFVDGVIDPGHLHHHLELNATVIR